MRTIPNPLVLSFHTTLQSQHNDTPVSLQHPCLLYRVFEALLWRSHGSNLARRTLLLRRPSQRRYTSLPPSRARLASHTLQPVCMSLSMHARSLRHIRLLATAIAWWYHAAVAGFSQGGPPGSGDDVPYHQSHQSLSRPSFGAPSIIKPIIDDPLLIQQLPDSVPDSPSPDRSSLLRHCDTGRIGPSPTHIHIQSCHKGSRVRL